MISARRADRRSRRIFRRHRWEGSKTAQRRRAAQSKRPLAEASESAAAPASHAVPAVATVWTGNSTVGEEQKASTSGRGEGRYKSGGHGVAPTKQFKKKQKDGISTASPQVGPQVGCTLCGVSNGGAINIGASIDSGEVLRRPREDALRSLADRQTLVPSVLHSRLAPLSVVLFVPAVDT